MENSITKKLFIEDSDIHCENMGDGIRRKIITYDEKLMLVKVEFARGAMGTVHRHYHTQVTYIEQGVFEVSINSETRILVAGSFFCATRCTAWRALPGNGCADGFIFSHAGRFYKIKS